MAMGVDQTYSFEDSSFQDLDILNDCALESLSMYGVFGLGSCGLEHLAKAMATGSSLSNIRKVTLDAPDPETTCQFVRACPNLMVLECYISECECPNLVCETDCEGNGWTGPGDVFIPLMKQVLTQRGGELVIHEDEPFDEPR